jgi:hypothetical protein
MVVREAISDHIVGVIGLVCRKVGVHDIKVILFLLLSIFFELVQIVTNHTLCVLHPLLHNVFLLLCLLGIGLIKGHLIVLCSKGEGVLKQQLLVFWLLFGRVVVHVLACDIANFRFNLLRLEAFLKLLFRQFRKTV